MKLNNRNYAADGAHSDPDTGLEESMWQLGLESSNKDLVYPERSGAPDCSYYIRTGYCGYGVRCRYNHPRDRGVVSKAPRFSASDHPEHASQPVCQNFLKTGACRFGSTCKYYHPRQVGGSVSLNYHGYPLRQGEKECPYYVKTGQCKFGSACKFHHPEPVSSFFSPPSSAVNPMVQPPLVPSPQQYPSLASWQVGRPSISPTTYMPGPYGPVYISSSIVPVPGWSPYPPYLIPGGQQMVQAGLSYAPPNQSSPSLSGHPAHSQKEYKLPERPEQPVCYYYIKTGVCKFGTRCRYHHPPELRIPNSNCVLSPLGLPLRPGAQPCPHYAQHGVCKSGLKCKYDHPVGTLSYNTPASSLSDPRVAPYHVGFSFGNLVPSAYPQLQPFFIIPNKEDAVT